MAFCALSRLAISFACRAFILSTPSPVRPLRFGRLLSRAQALHALLLDRRELRVVLLGLYTLEALEGLLGLLLDLL